MTEKKVLIITDSGKAGAKFFAAPFALSPEKVTVTGVASLNYIGFTGYAAVIIDCPALINDLTKISLGIRDSIETEALWRIFCGETGVEVFILVEQKAAPSKTMRELGIDYLLSGEIAELVAEYAPASADSGNTTGSRNVLTADDIRDLHQQGQRHIPPGSSLTAWALEVAEALGLTQNDNSLKYLLDLSNFSPSGLKARQEDIFALSTRIPELLFVLNPLSIPSFNQVFPSLRGRVVCSTIHWATQGAFTGETSAAMLADMRCHGAIVPARQPYCRGENLKELLKQAQKNDLELFSTFTLASGTDCDIIASEDAASKQLTPLYEARLTAGLTLPETGAIIARPEEFTHLPFRKG